MNKKTIIIPLLLSMSLLTACGENLDMAKEYSSSSYTNNITYDNASVAEEYNADSEASEDTNSTEKKNNTSSDVIRKEMLVYSCNMVVDVLDFDAAHASLKNALNSYGAFVENENYNSGGTGGRYYDPKIETWKTYSATIRVPSEDYDSFCEETAKLGDLRSKNASVQNMSREYYDLSATLEIYEEKEKRYMELLSTITDEKYAISVEEELTSIQIEISKLKTRMNDIKTDVAYSYVYLTMNEVKEYTAEPEKTDTFSQRLSNTVSKATSSFLAIMENILFIFIYLFPHLAVIGIVLFAAIFIIKKSNKKRNMKNMAAVPVPPQPIEENDEEEPDNQE